MLCVARVARIVAAYIGRARFQANVLKKLCLFNNFLKTDQFVNCFV